MARGVKVDINDLVKTLKPYLLDGCSLHEACCLTFIPYTTMVDYVKSNESVRRKIASYKNDILHEARKSVKRGIKEDPRLAFDFMRHKKSDEFSTAHKVESKNTNINAETTSADIAEQIIKSHKDG